MQATLEKPRGALRPGRFPRVIAVLFLVGLLALFAVKSNNTGSPNGPDRNCFRLKLSGSVGALLESLERSETATVLVEITRAARPNGTALLFDEGFVTWRFPISKRNNLLWNVYRMPRSDFINQISSFGPSRPFSKILPGMSRGANVEMVAKNLPLVESRRYFPGECD